MRPTSDGISGGDWDAVHQLTLDIVNAGTEEAHATARQRLLRCLDDLEVKYGSLPSILATRADFIDDPAVKRKLFHRAYAVAEARGDRRNMVYVAHSLAELYIEDHRDPVSGREWLDRLRREVVEIDDSWAAKEHERLLSAVNQLDYGDSGHSP